MRNASIRSFGDRSRTTVSTLRRPSGRGVTVAMMDHSPAVPVEMTSNAMPPSRGRFRTSLMCSNAQRLPLRRSSTTSMQSLRPISASEAAVEAKRVELVDPGEQRGERITRHLDRGGRPLLSRRRWRRGGRARTDRTRHQWSRGGSGCRHQRKWRCGRPARSAATSRRRSGSAAPPAGFRRADPAMPTSALGALAITAPVESRTTTLRRTQRGAAGLVALEHGPADLDPMPAAEPLLDCRGQP